MSTSSSVFAENRSLWACPSPSIQRPLSAPPRMRATSLARSASGSGVMCAHARLAHSWRSTRGIAATVGRFSGSGPLGGTTESSTSAETWLG